MENKIVKKMLNDLQKYKFMKKLNKIELDSLIKMNTEAPEKIEKFKNEDFTKMIQDTIKMFIINLEKKCKWTEDDIKELKEFYKIKE